MTQIIKQYLIVVLMMTVLSPGPARGAKPAAAANPTVEVSAEGKVMAVPDLALLTLEVVTQASLAEATAQENARRADALLKALKQALGPDDQVKTLGFRLNPVYAAKDKSAPPEIKGYQAVNRLQVKVKGPARLGSIIDLALKSGASGVNGPFWEHSGLEGLQRQAAVAALERARDLAEALAQAQGLKIKEVQKISTGIYFRPHQGYGEARTMAAPGAPPTPIEVGEEEIKASVQAVFSLKP